MTQPDRRSLARRREDQETQERIDELIVRTRRLQVSSYVKYALVFIAFVLGSWRIVVLVNKVQHTQDQFCLLARTNRHTLEQQWANTRLYLSTPVGRQHTGLNDYIRQISVPQLRKRLATETVPVGCAGPGR